MDGKGWKPEYGISPEGIEVLGFVEALPKEVRRELVQVVAKLCREEGYLSLHDDLRSLMDGARTAGRDERPAKVIPLFSARRRG